MKRNGFTLIEMLVVIAVMALLSGLAIVYSHVGQNQVALSVESAKVAQLILEAKDLSVATYSDKKNTCGYGVHFDYSTNRYSLFEYDLPSGQSICPSLASTTATGYMTNPGVLQMNEYAFGGKIRRLCFVHRKPIQLERFREERCDADESRHKDGERDERFDKRLTAAGAEIAPEIMIVCRGSHYEFSLSAHRFTCPAKLTLMERAALPSTVSR